MIKNAKSSKIKLITTPKIKGHIFNNNKSKVELRSKIICNIKDEEEKNLLINLEHNDNLAPLDDKNKLDMNCILNYESKLNNAQPNEKSTKTDDSSGEEKIKRKIQVQAPLNLNEKINRGFKKNMPNINMNKYNLSLSLMNYINNKPFSNNIISKLSKEGFHNKNEVWNKNLIIKKAIYYKDYNIKKERQNFVKGKSLTETNINISTKNKFLDNSNNDKNLLYTHNIRKIGNHNTEGNFNKVFIKNKSYDCLKAVTIKKIYKNYTQNNDKKINNNVNNDINNIDNNQNILKENNDVCHYIKVNKKKINKNNKDNIANKNNNAINNYRKEEEKNKIQITNVNREIESKNKNDKINKKLINNKRNLLWFDIKKENKTCKNEFIDRKTKNKTNGYKKIEKANDKYNNNLPINKTEQIKKKSIKIFDKNKLEHNIFLDKTYQNRFKKQTKNQNEILNDIFTSDKQREYNTFIVKKKSNYLNNQILNSINSSSSNGSNKDWVYRLYNKEIKKQKIKDKIILLLRKSILNEKKEEKKLNKSKTVKQFKSYNCPINDEYNIDDNFNIINLFLSDDKKKKKKK